MIINFLVQALDIEPHINDTRLVLSLFKSRRTSSMDIDPAISLFCRTAYIYSCVSDILYNIGAVKNGRLAVTATPLIVPAAWLDSFPAGIYPVPEKWIMSNQAVDLSKQFLIFTIRHLLKRTNPFF